MCGIRGTRSRIPKRTCAAAELKTQLQRRRARALSLRTWNVLWLEGISSVQVKGDECVRAGKE